MVKQELEWKCKYRRRFKACLDIINGNSYIYSDKFELYYKNTGIEQFIHNKNIFVDEIGEYYENVEERILLFEQKSFEYLFCRNCGKMIYEWYSIQHKLSETTKKEMICLCEMAKYRC